MTKLYVSVDIEGVAGIVHSDQAMATGQAYSLGQRLLMGEIDALCMGASLAGAESIVLNDAHSNMRNILPDGLPANARVITGHFKPMYMMEGLDDGFDAVVFLGYHGPVGSSSVLSHTYNPRVIWEAKLNGHVTGETGINALVAHHFGLPVILITGDDITVAEAKEWIPEADGLCVKRSIGRFAAESMSPVAARSAITQRVQDALRLLPVQLPPFTSQFELELTLQSAEMATLAEWAGAKRAGDRTVVLVAVDGLQLYRKFHMTLLLARTVVDS